MDFKNEHLATVSARLNSSMTPEQRRALRAYQLFSPADMNYLSEMDQGKQLPWSRRIQMLRKDSMRASSIRLDELIRSAPRLSDIDGVPDSITLYRGIGHGKWTALGREAVLKRVQEDFPVGQRFDIQQQHRFHSWTPRPEIARAFMVPSPLSLRRGFLIRLRDHRLSNYLGHSNKLFREYDFVMPRQSGDMIVTGHSIEALPRLRWKSFGRAHTVVVDVRWSDPDDPFNSADF